MLMLMSTAGHTQANVSNDDGQAPQADRSAGRTSLERILAPVRSYWGFDSLRPLQEEAIRASLDGQDSVVVMPTGGGKSLCYQVPPCVTNHTDIVVSPLISLMKDQVDGLQTCGYAAAAIHSGRSSADNAVTMRDFREGRLRLVFVSPERLLMPAFLNMIEQAGVRSFAIDEAHCISHWGHDFRQEYRKFAQLKQRFPNAGVHAYTATATQRVRDDIAMQLRLVDPLMLVGTFDRPNLIYRIVPRLDVYDQVLDVMSRHKGEGVIVYCLSRKDTEAMAETLRGAGIDARAYHAGLETSERAATQEAFANESLHVVAATVAFGMGIDRSNVRCVIHATMPKSIEHYQQETGRAGRDGLEAECVLFYSPADPMRWQSLIARSAADSNNPEQVIASATQLIDEMRRYCAAPCCRHRAISKYFEQEYSATNCEACDVCLDETAGTEDATEVAVKIISCVARVERMSGFNCGVGHIADVLMGADTEGVRRRGHDHATTYGILRGMPKKTLTNLVYQLVDQGLLERTRGKLPVVQLNLASWEVMRGQRTVQLIRAAAEPVRETRGEAASWEGVDRPLFDHLRGVRHTLATERGVPAYVIFSDRTLRDLARRRPVSIETFQEVHGIGKSKLAQFADQFIREIETFCRDNDLDTNVGAGRPPPSVVRDDGSNPSPRPTRQTRTMSATRQHASKMFAEGASIDDVAEATGRATTTVAGYLCAFIEATKPDSIDRWVDAETYDAVARAAGELGARRLKPIFEQLDGKIEYDQIRLTLAHLEVRSD